MKPIDYEAVRQQLAKLADDFEPPLRGKTKVLLPLRAEVFRLHEKGATVAEIAAMLSQFGITVSKDTVMRFIREQAPTPKHTTGESRVTQTECSS